MAGERDAGARLPVLALNRTARAADSLDLDAEPYDSRQQDQALAALRGGLLPLGSQGCSVVQCLVLSGAHAGRVLIIDWEHSSPPVFEPHRHFLDWYEHWLDDVISGQKTRR